MVGDGTSQVGNGQPQSIQRLSWLAFLAVAGLIVLFALLINGGLSWQQTMLQASGLSFEQRILLERSNEQWQLLMESAHEPSLTDRVLLNILKDLNTNRQQLVQNQQRLDTLVSHWRLASAGITTEMARQREPFQRYTRRMQEIGSISLTRLRAGYNLWKPDDALIVHEGALLDGMTRLNVAIYQQSLQQNRIMYLLYATLLLLVLLGVWLIWFLKLRPLSEQLDNYARELARQNDVLIFRSTHDPLTRLPNRVMFNEALATLSQPGSGLFLLDLDRFKSINDTFGHQAGDAALIEFARRLGRDCLADEIAYRLGGDEFAIIFTTPKTRQALVVRARAIQAGMSTPLHYNNQGIQLDCSIGIAWGAACGQSPQSMFSAADAALYAVKEQGRGRFLFFDDVYSHNAEVMLALERDLHVAVQQRQFTVYYQPIVCMNDGRTIGLEALVRWQRPEFGLLLPAAWIDSAERLAKLSSITCQVIEQVAQDCRHWHRQGLNPGLLHLNITEGMLVSGMTLQFLSRTFAQAFQGEEGRPGMPQQLSVEVTESVLIDRSFTVLKQQLQQLRAAGIQVALDDFGSGFATLAHLNSIPFDTLKLDHRFTGKLLEDEGTQVIVRALIFMAAGLNKTLIFEGVSNPMLHDALLAMGARYAQGFFYSKPLPAGGVSAWLEGQTAQQEYSKHDC